MASWFDILALAVTVILFVGTIAGLVYVSQQVSQAVQSTKESLKNKGWNISEQGVSVKTSRRFNREDYVDATQRAFVKALSTSTYGSSSHDGDHKVPVIERQTSSISDKSTEGKKKKGLLGGMLRSQSGRSTKLD